MRTLLYSAAVLWLASGADSPGSSENTPIFITARVGSSTVLPCDCSKNMSSVIPLIEWKTSSGKVFERSDNRSHQNARYEGRVDVPKDKLKMGDCSLELKDVKSEDAGVYKSYLVVNGSEQTKRDLIQSVNLSVDNSTKAPLKETPKPQDLSVEAPPDVQVFAHKSERDSSKLILTCLITGFYHRDVKMSLRKFTTSFPDHLITSSGVIPNDDGTYQLRKSVEISDSDSADYDCYVNHSSFKEPVIKKWDGRCTDCPNNVWIIIVSVSVVVVVLGSVILTVLIKKNQMKTREENRYSAPVRMTCTSAADEPHAGAVNIYSDRQDRINADR